MCGIAGLINSASRIVDPALVRQMTRAMAHRGPDDESFYSAPGITLGHLRLAIIDLSAAANQPFSDNSGRYIMIYNGEIYNYAEVKPLLPDYQFKTHSDTEMMVAAYATWGVDCLKYFRGMYSFAIWDTQLEELFIARDRLGVKPLYYWKEGEQFIFASEIRGILATGLVKRKINPRALLDYFSYQSVPSPHSMIEGIKELEAGCWMKLKKGDLEIKRYWDVTDRHNGFDFSQVQAVHTRIRELMLQSVKRRLVADVPVGAFLSGGIDSSVVVGLMAEASSARPNTFNISFDEKEFDESVYAEEVAKKFNAHHTRINMKATAFLDELQEALDAMDTPSGDGINTYVVSKVIRQKGMTVALSGVGGDELFAGYPYFQQYLQIQKNRWLWNLPEPVRELAAIGGGARKDRMKQLLRADTVAIENVYPVFRQIISIKKLKELTHLVDGGSTITSLEKTLDNKKTSLAALPLLSQVSAGEYLGYTQHTLLKDTDQMSMAVSLEVREPFFDQDLVEFVLAIPDELKNPVYPKSLLVESVKPLLPHDIVHRKKQGFVFPWNQWMKQELKEFCARHIDNLAQRSFIQGPALQKFWNDFLKGDPSIRWAEVWLFVVLEYWMEKNEVES